MKKFVGLKKTYSYLKGKGDEYKKRERRTKLCYKTNLKFKDFKKCLKTSQIENVITYLGKKKIDAESLEEIAKCKKVIIKIQQRFKSEGHNLLLKKLTRLL